MTEVGAMLGDGVGVLVGVCEMVGSSVGDCVGLSVGCGDKRRIVKIIW